jgi:hypothetical protein
LREPKPGEPDISFRFSALSSAADRRLFRGVFAGLVGIGVGIVVPEEAMGRPAWAGEEAGS